MSGPAAELRVLIADDDAILREIAAATLKAAGLHVQCVATGDSAVAACALRMPDVALLDVEMQEGNGYQACTNIRALPAGSHLPIMMVTGSDDPESIEKAYAAGATDFVVKPINWPLLTHRIRHVLRGACTIAALRRSEERNAALLRALPDGVFLVDLEGRVEHCFSPLKELFEESGQSFIRRGLVDSIPGGMRMAAIESFAAALRGEPTAFEFSSRRPDGTSRDYECRCLPNSANQVLAIIRDVTGQPTGAKDIQRLAYFDALTGLPNREWLRKQLARSLVEARRLKRHVALLYLGLDQFKRVNDTLGRDSGDALLRQVAERLKTALHLQDEGAEPSRGRLARVGGDEFVIMLTGRTDLRGAEAAAKRILAVHAAPFLQTNEEFIVSPSIGIAVFPEHGGDAQNLLQHAEAAMHKAKAGGRNQFNVHESVVDVRAFKRLSLETELRRAVENSSLDVYYQPMYAIDTLEIVGAEALLRWFHPERGQIPTPDFIAVAEETGLIADMGRWTLSRVCRDFGVWRTDGVALPRMAVNLSGRDLMHPEALRRMTDTIIQANLSPALFELEFTEGVLMRDAEAGRKTLLALKESGFGLAVDDFGTGYCSLNHLKRFPLDTLKIDRSLVAGSSEDPDDAAIVRAIIALGHSLDLKTVAKGVETSAQLQFLQAETCDAMQGFLMSAAVSAVQFAAMLHDPSAATLLSWRPRESADS